MTDILHEHGYQPAFTTEELRHIRKYGTERAKFNAPTVLIVEDQAFSRNLLYSTLSRQYICYCATNAQEAVLLYAEHVPCITFLDIELPDYNGHGLAAFIKQHDPQSYIVMVTANHYEKDVLLAQQNQVNGFITKPYSKQKILDAIQTYIQMNKLRKTV